MNPEGLRFIHLFGGASDREPALLIHGANRWGVRVEGETPTIGPGRFGANIDFVRISGRGQGDLLGTYHADWYEQNLDDRGLLPLGEWVRGWGLALRYSVARTITTWTSLRMSPESEPVNDNGTLMRD